MHRAFVLLILILGLLLIDKGECMDPWAWNRHRIAGYDLYPDASVEGLTMSLSEIHPLVMYASSQRKLTPDRRPNSREQSHVPQGIRTNAQFYDSVQVNSNQAPRNLRAQASQPPLNYGFIPHVPISKQNRGISKDFFPQTAETSPQKRNHRNLFDKKSEHFTLPPNAKADMERPHLQQNNRYSGNIQLQSEFSHIGQQIDSILNAGIHNTPLVFRQATVHQVRPQVPRPRNLLKQHNGHSAQDRSVQNNHPGHNNIGNHRGQNGGHQITVNHPGHNGGHQKTGNHPGQNGAHQNIGNHRVQNGAHENTGNHHPRYIESFQNNLRQVVSQNNRQTVRYNAQNDRQNSQSSNRANNGHKDEENSSNNNNNSQRLLSISENIHGDTRLQLPNILQNREPTVIHLADDGEIKHSSPSFFEGLNPDSQLEEKKTYLIFKAPTLVTTERPSSAPYSVTSTVNNPTTEVKYEVQPHTDSSDLSTKLNTAAVVIDLVPLPDVDPQNQNRNTLINSDSIFQPDKQQNIYKDDSGVRDAVTTTSAEDNYDYYVGHPNGHFSAVPRIMEDLKAGYLTEHERPTNASSHSISYSSSVSVATNQRPLPKQPSKSPKKSSVTKKKSKDSINYNSAVDDLYGNENVPGRPGTDYPTFNEIPFTNFDCREFKSPGFYADLEASCQVFHNCDMGMKKHSFMCPNGTIFHQELFICDWWYNVNCDDSPEFFSLNGGLFLEPKRKSHSDSQKKDKAT